jgi:hypothetical protein
MIKDLTTDFEEAEFGDDYREDFESRQELAEKIKEVRHYGD